MSEFEYFRLHIRETLLRILTPDLKPGEVLEAVEAFEADAAHARQLAEKRPPIPRDFFERWADRFSDWAVTTHMPARLDRLCEGSTASHRLLLLEYFDFCSLFRKDLEQELHHYAAEAGETLDELKLTLEATALYAEERLKG